MWSDCLFWSLLVFSTGGYSVNGGSGENTYGRKSLGQELRVNNVTNADFTSVPHGNRALATKDMRKSQGKVTTDFQERRISFSNISFSEKKN